MKKLTVVLFSLLLWSSQSLAGLAGVVLMSKGQALASSNGEEPRPLKRRSKIMEGDVITTKADGKIQIRFVDRALLTLKPNSKLDVSAYQLAKQEGGDEEVVMSLITGGFRTITGSIGKGEKSAYTVKTPAASIGIRGTNYEVQQELDGNFVMAVWEGGITVSNEQGALDIGSNAEFKFVRVNAKEEPQGLEEPPASIAQSSTTKNVPKEPEEKGQEEDTEESEEGEETENSDGNADEGSDETSEAEEAQEESDVVIEDGDSDSALADTGSEESATDSELEDELERAEEEASTIEETPLPELTQISSIDTRFSDWEYTYLLSRPKAGLLINNQDNAIDNVLVVQDTDAGTDPVFIQAGASIGNNLNVESFELNVVNGIDTNNTVSDSDFVSWGRWNNSIDVHTDPSSSNTVNTDFYWLSAEAANLSSLIGSASFSGETDFLGDINGDAITNMAGQFDVNFATGDISNGELNFGNDNQGWALTFDGSVTGVNANMNNIQGSITDTINNVNLCTTCINGDIQGIFARPGDHFVGGFTLDSATTSDTANGVFSMKGTRP